MAIDLPRGSSTDELIAVVVTHGFAEDEATAVVSAAIDAVYAARDAGCNMHEAGAAAALAGLQAQSRLFAYSGPLPDEDERGSR